MHPPLSTASPAAVVACLLSVEAVLGAYQAPCGMPTTPRAISSVTRTVMRIAPTTLSTIASSPVAMPRGCASAGFIHRRWRAREAPIPPPSANPKLEWTRMRSCQPTHWSGKRAFAPSAEVAGPIDSVNAVRPSHSGSYTGSGAICCPFGSSHSRDSSAKRAEKISILPEGVASGWPAGSAM